MYVVASIFVSVTLALFLIAALVCVARDDIKKHEKKTGLRFKENLWKK